MATSLEQRFLAFRASGDPELMAAVFDATAAKLGKLAAHLCRDTSEVEELVQATFVAVLEERDRYRAGDRLLPWMLGILTHQWHHLVRERVRRPDPERLPATGPREDPHVHACTRELSEALRKHLAKMQEPYTEVLQLHLLGGLEAREIAERLRRNRGTVRAQLHRGLERLRQLLPAGFAAGVAPTAALLTPQQLAAMRHHILNATATTITPAGGATLTLTTLSTLTLMKKTLAITAAALALVALWIWQPWSEIRPETAYEHGHRAQGGIATAPESAGDSTAVGNRSPVAVALAPQMRDSVGGREVTFNGRCVDWTTGRPLAGVEITLRAWSMEPETDYRYAQGELVEPQPARSDEDGRFRLRGVLPRGGAHALGLVFARPDRVQRIGTWYADELTGETHLGDIRMHEGIRVRGVVVDDSGQPVQRAWVRFPNAEMDQALRRFDHTSSGTATTTGIDGSFEIPSAVPPGLQPLYLRANGYQPQGPGRVFLAPGGVATLRLSMVGNPAIEGIVADARGKPLAGVRVSAALPGQNITVGCGESGADGRFVVRRSDSRHAEASHAVELWFGSDGTVVPPAGGLAARWGERGITVCGGPARTVEVLVVSKQDGRPVTDFGVICSPVVLHRGRDLATGDRAFRLAGHHTGGRLVVDKVWPGKNQIQVVPRDPALVSSDVVQFALPEGKAAPVRIELESAQAVRIQVCDVRGQPVAQTRVEVLEVDPEDEEPIHEVRSDSLLGRGSTNATGRVTLHVPTRLNTLTLQVKGRGHLATLFKEQPIPTGDQPIRLVVRDGARLCGVLAPKELVVPDIGLVLLHQDAFRRFPRQEHGVLPIRSDGSFDLRNLPPGQWSLHLQFGNDVREPALAKVELVDGGEVTLDLEASAHMPAKLTGRVLVCGRAPEGVAAVSLYPAKGMVVDTDIVAADGSFTLADIPAGRYRVGLRQPVDGNYKCFLHPEWITLQPGQTVERVFDLEHRRVVVRLLRKDGTPVQLPRAILRSKTCAFAWSFPIDSGGNLQLDPAPPVACDVWVGDRVLGELPGFATTGAGVPGNGRQEVLELRARDD